MKSLRFVLSVVLLSLATTVVFAQSHEHESAAPVAQSDAQKSAVAPVPTEAQKAFTAMKSLAGEWEGSVTIVDMPEAMKAKMGADKIAPLHVSLRVTSRGNLLVHEMQEAGTPLDATKYDHPVTMVYLDGDQINLIHYCDAGNRPRMAGKLSPDGKTVEFAFVDITGRNQKQHMDHGIFTIVDADHHIEDWT